MVGGGRTRTTLAAVNSLRRLEPLTAGPGMRGLRGALRDPARSLAAGGVAAALLVGVALAADVPTGTVVLIALCYVPLVFVNLQLALALWVPLAFLQGIPALNLGGEAAGLLIAASWFGTLRSRGEVVRAVFGRHRGLLAILCSLLVWLSLSLGWSDDAGLGIEDLWHWYALALLFVVVMTTLTTMNAIRMVLFAFVAGAVLSVASGVADGSLTNQVDGGARLAGGAGDPNFLAASIVAATVLAGGLLAVARSVAVRWLLAAAITVLIAGLVWSASRGGALAAGVTIIAALVVFKRQRIGVAAVTAVALGIAALTFANAPNALERVTTFDEDGGRSDLWTVAWRMGEDYPIIGVGLNNFLEHSGDYIRRPGEIERADQIVDQPHFVHNTYLQLFAENGLVGLALYLALIGACLRATKLAADRFNARGDLSSETLARVILVASISILAAAVFLSAALDQRLWLLLALGPALVAASSSPARQAPQQTSRDRGSGRNIEKTVEGSV